ncbi:MAG: hypothetical protein M3433_05375 [Actinomycetota bacterium]|nr:hypothetical protein [Actinomycetota bacterium]
MEVGALALTTGLLLAAIPVPVYLGLALLLDRYESRSPCSCSPSCGGRGPPRA